MKKSIIVLLLSIFASTISFAQETQQQTGAAVEIVQTDSSYSVMQIPRPVTPEQFLGRLDQIVQQLQTPAVEAYGQMVQRERLDAILKLSLLATFLVLSFSCLAYCNKKNSKEPKDQLTPHWIGILVSIIVLGVCSLITLISTTDLITQIVYPQVAVIERLLGM